MFQKSNLVAWIHSESPRLAFALSLPGKVFRKYLWWADITNRAELKVPVFILGMQRSGTTMIFNVLAKCPECGMHRGHQKHAFRNSRIRSGETIKRLIRKSYKKVVVFKPLNDIQHTRTLLGLHENARGIWVYRHFNDVANSAVERWNTAHLDIIRGIASGLVLNPGHDAMREGMDPDDVELVKQMCRQEMSPEEGAALLWYLRNLIYFKLKLQHDPRIFLVKYEDLVTDPRYHFCRVLEHVSCEFRPECIEGVFSSSIAKAKAPILREDIKTLCEGMLARLNEQYLRLQAEYSSRPKIRIDTRTPVFVLGCYRSGKTTLLKTIDHSPECTIYSEGNRLAYKNYRIRSDRTIKSLIRKNTKKVVVFELVNDLQNADRFLGLYPQCKAIWLYRSYHGVIEGALERWGSLWRDYISNVVGRSSDHRDQRRVLMERIG